MIETCDICHASALEKIYEPSGGGRGLSVYLCTNCGLVQSLPRADRAPRRSAAVSSGADWGNVRYGKGFRTEACLKRLGVHADLTQPLSVLDVGSNRGSFARAFLAAAPEAQLTCVEPDERVVQSCAGLERSTLVHARIEDAALAEESFDVIHSCHTIEHLASPYAVLTDHWRTLKEGGLLVVDAPNIALIGGDDILEEWFIDKHLYHFSRATLTWLLTACGFEIVGSPDPNDRENLLFAARKRPLPARSVRRDPTEVEWSRNLIAAYVENRTRNLAALTHVAAELKRMAPRRVALWGAGRLFDALVLNGGFDPTSLAGLVDTHLKQHMSERHGVALSGPDQLAGIAPGVIVVMSRAFAKEIADIARERAPKAEIVFYADLISEARNRRAA